MARTAKAVIDNAIEENRANEYLLYLFAVLFVIVGIALISWAVYRNQPLAALAGAIESSLFAPAVYFLRQIRRENLKLRLLELPLSSAQTADEAAQALIKLFAADFGENQGHNRKGKDVTSQTLRQ